MLDWNFCVIILEILSAVMNQTFTLNDSSHKYKNSSFKNCSYFYLFIHLCSNPNYNKKENNVIENTFLKVAGE